MKQVILVRQDLNLPKGKLGAQCGHAAVAAFEKAGILKRKRWTATGMKKVVLKVPTEKDLYEYKQQAKDAGIPCALISDAGRTIVEPGTVTCLGIGPDDEDKIDAITGKLKML